MEMYYAGSWSATSQKCLQPKGTGNILAGLTCPPFSQRRDKLRWRKTIARVGCLLFFEKELSTWGLVLSDLFLTLGILSRGRKPWQKTLSTKY